MRVFGTKSMLHLVLAACLLESLVTANLSARAEPLKVRLGTSTSGDEQLWLLEVRPDLVGKNYGKAYTLDTKTFPSGAVRAQALAADAIDLASGAAATVIAAASQGVEAKVIASISRLGRKGFYDSFYVKAESPIKTIADMKGKIVGINGLSTSGHLELVAGLAKAGLKDTDVTITAVPFSAMQEALSAGKIDVGMFVVPYGALLEREMKVRKIFDARDGMPFDQELIVVTAKDTFLKANADAVRAMLVDLQAATNFYLENTREARQISDRCQEGARHPRGLFEHARL